MIYTSTRGGERCSDVQAVLKGPACDGGLFVPEDMGKIALDWRECAGLAPLALAAKVIGALLPGFEDMPQLVKSAYSHRFETEDITPLVPVGDDFVLELFRGPTSAFKDVALSMLPRLMTAARRQQGEKGETAILTATSGDTGKAALEGFHDVAGTRIIVFYPYGGVSAVQRAQMATQRGENVCVCAVRGNFDDCQSAVKAAFSKINGEGRLADTGVALSSANSINIGRLVPQMVYYYSAYLQLLARGRIAAGEEADFVVPTGNFGDILAGYYAKRLGLPVGRLVCASNVNRVLTDFFDTGVYDRRREFKRSSSPSMDILISSNLERLIYHASKGDCELVKKSMAALSAEGAYTLPESVMGDIRAVFSAGCCDEGRTAETIKRIWREHGYLCDTHTAVAAAVARDYRKTREGSAPVVILSTASPYKFPGAVLAALGGDASCGEFDCLRKLRELTGVPVPGALEELESLPERHSDVIEKTEILDYILARLGGKRP